MTLIDELRSRASATSDDDVEFIEQTLVWKAADRIAELEAALKLIASGMRGDRILADWELSDIAQRALTPKPTKE